MSELQHFENDARSEPCTRTKYTYDKDRNLTQKVLNGGQTVNLTWDIDDRNLTLAYPADSTLNVSKTYDQSGHGKGVGRLTSVTDQAGSDSFTYEERGLITAESRVITSIGTLATSTGYDGAGRVSSITYPSGTLASYTRNSMGLVTSVSATPYGGSATSIASSIAYNPFGPVSGLTFGNGITGAYGYDGSYRNTGRVDNATAGDILDLAYAYKNNGSLYTITDSVTSANSQTLGYDAMNRVTSATSAAGGYGSYAWTWDAVGNVATQDINSVTTTYSLNAGSNQLASYNNGTTTTTVDTTSNGNILDLKVGGTPITSFTYSAANQLASGTGPLSASASFKYGFNGMRLLKTPSSGYPITLQYGPGGALLAENDLHSGQTADYIYLDPGSDNRPIGQVNPASGDVYYTHTDRQGTPQAVTDGSQNVAWDAYFNPFGDTATFSGSLTTQSLRLPGQYFDPELGTNHNGFRDYAGPLTRYIESDPLGLGGGMNTYQYAANNPGMFTDPSGLDQSCTISPQTFQPVCTDTGGGKSSDTSKASGNGSKCDASCIAKLKNGAETVGSASDLLQMAGKDVKPLGTVAGAVGIGATIQQCSKSPTAQCSLDIGIDAVALSLDPVSDALTLYGIYESAFPPAFVDDPDMDRAVGPQNSAPPKRNFPSWWPFPTS